MDIVYIRDLEIATVIGIHDWERGIRQTISLDLDMATDIRPAADSGDISRALDYQAVSERLTAFVGHSDYALLETLAERIAALVLDEFDVPWLRLRVGKPGAIPGAKDVGVVIERGQRPDSPPGTA